MRKTPREVFKTGDAAKIDFRRDHEVFHGSHCFWRMRRAVFNDLVFGRYVANRRYAVWRRYGYEDWTLICTAAGRGRVGPPPKPIVLHPRQIVLIPPGVTWDYGIVDGERVWDQFGLVFRPRPEWYPLLSRWPVMIQGVRIVSLSAPLHRRAISRLEDTLHFARGHNPQRHAMVLNAVEELLLWCDAENTQRGPAAIDPRVRRVMEYLDGHSETDASMGELAAQVGVSVSRLCHLFRHHLHIPPREFLEQRRIERARELLDHSALSIGRIAQTVGFGDAFYFSRRFRRAMAMSPREYRQRLRGGQREVRL